MGEKAKKRWREAKGRTGGGQNGGRENSLRRIHVRGGVIHLEGGVVLAHPQAVDDDVGDVLLGYPFALGVEEAGEGAGLLAW